jgi:hypothetical protein
LRGDVQSLNKAQLFAGRHCDRSSKLVKIARAKTEMIDPNNSSCWLARLITPRSFRSNQSNGDHKPTRLKHASLRNFG